VAEQNPSLLTIILDTNPAAWSLLSSTIPLSKAVASLLIFINAHLACSYTNKVAVVASHCDTAEWLYPTSAKQHASQAKPAKRGLEDNLVISRDQLSEPTKRLKLNGPRDEAANDIELGSTVGHHDFTATSDKYRPFRVVEEELLRNLSTLLAATNPGAISSTTSTMIAGALTLALSYINRQNASFAESSGGATNTADSAPPNASSRAADATNKTLLHSRILLISVSPSHDLAHQYIPIMNSIFACQRLSIPIDICQIPTPNAPSSSTVFLQQASDATKGIYIPLSSATSGGLLQYLMMAFLPTQSSRLHLVLPTRIDVDFRAACFCHRRVVDVGFVCSICLSIFCSPPENGDCLTCGTHLELGDYGGRPMVVPRQKKKKRTRTTLDGSRVSTPTPGPS
jgi:transcription initiation factor TFIIH subunit 3